jgi:hypothetical protein
MRSLRRGSDLFSMNRWKFVCVCILLTRFDAGVLLFINIEHVV